MGSVSDRIKQKREELKKRTEEQYNRKDEFAPSVGYFKQGVKDLVLFRPDKGTHVIDVLPFVAGPNMPKEQNVQDGDLAYVLDIYVHQNVGASEEQVVCLAKNWGQRCPICEHQKELRREVDFDEGLVKSLYPKRRTAYNIICYDNTKEEEKGVQVMEVSHWFFEKHIAALAMNKRTNQFVPFSDPTQAGKSIQWEVKETTYDEKQSDGTVKKRKGNDWHAHQFLERDYAIPDDDLDCVFQLDDLVKIPEFAGVYEMYWGEPYEEDQPASSGRRPRQAATGEKVSEPETTGRRRRATSEATQEEPAQGSTRRARTSVKVNTEESECPAAGEFGVSVDTMEACNSCDVYDRCVAKNEAIRASEAQPEQKPGSEGATTTSAPVGRRRRR